MVNTRKLLGLGTLGLVLGDTVKEKRIAKGLGLVGVNGYVQMVVLRNAMPSPFLPGAGSPDLLTTVFRFLNLLAAGLLFLLQ